MALAMLSTLALSSGLTAQEVCRASWEIEETLRVGSASGDLALTLVTDLDVGPDGRIYLTQMMVPEVWVLSPDGAFERTLGRAGAGPGEFLTAASHLGWRGDSLWVADSQRLHWFADDGASLGTVDFRTHVLETGSILVPGVPLADGTFLPARMVNDYRTFAAPVASRPIKRLSPDGEIVDTLGVVPWADRFADFRLESGPTLREEHPLAPRAPPELGGASVKRATSRDGRSLTVVHAPSSHGAPSHFRIVRLSLAGDTLVDAAVPFTPRPVEPPLATRLTEQFARWMTGDFSPNSPQMPEQLVRQRRRAVEASLTLPAFHPPVREVLVGLDDTIWLLRESNPDGTDRWEVHAPDGTALGALEIREGRGGLRPWEPRMRILQASRDGFWGTTLDEWDVPILHYFRISGCEAGR